MDERVSDEVLRIIADDRHIIAASTGTVWAKDRRIAERERDLCVALAADLLDYRQAARDLVDEQDRWIATGQREDRERAWDMYAALRALVQAEFARDAFSEDIVGVRKAHDDLKLSYAACLSALETAKLEIGTLLMERSRADRKAEAAEAAAARWQEQAGRMREALVSLRNEVSGAVTAFRLEIREAIGNTNLACIENRLREADAALSPAPAAPVHQATDGGVNGDYQPAGDGVTLREMVQAIRQGDSYPVIYADFVAEALARAFAPPAPAEEKSC